MQAPSISRGRAALEAFVVIGIFMANTAMMNFTTWFDVFEFLPVLGRAIPNFTLALLVILYLYSTERGLQGIGVGRPRNFAGLLWWGALIAGGFAATCYFILPVAIPIGVEFLTGTFGLETPPPSGRLAPLVGNLPLFALIIPLMWVMAAFGEEVVSRGFIFTRIARAFGANGSASWIAWVIAAIAQAFFFGAAHFWAGPPGMVFAGSLGFLAAILVILARGNLWPAIILHGAWNTWVLYGVYSG